MQVYFEQERNLNWPFVYKGTFKQSDSSQVLKYYTSDIIALLRKDFLCYSVTHDRYLRLREPPDSLKQVFSNEEWQSLTREYSKLSDEATEKLLKLEELMGKNPYNGLSTRFFRWQGENIAKKIFGCFQQQQQARMLKSHEQIPAPWNPCLRHFICIFSVPLISMFMLPAALYLAYTVFLVIVIDPILSAIDFVSQNKKEALKYFNEMALGNPDLDMMKIEESLVSGLISIAENLNQGKLRGSGIIAEPYFGVEYIPGADKDPGFYVNRYLVLFKKHAEV